MKKGARYRKKQIWLVLKGQDFEEKKTSLAEKVPQSLHCLSRKTDFGRNYQGDLGFLK